MIGYKELIAEDNFDKKDVYFVEGNLTKMCWGCETKHKTGYMVKDVSKGRRIFFCKECFDNLNS
jgi:hypothetical protein